MKNSLAFVAVAAFVSAACRAASPPPVPENLLACSKLQDAAERVRCYDAQIAKMNQAAGATAAPAEAVTPASGAIAPAPAPTSATTAPTLPSAPTPAAATTTQPVPAAATAAAQAPPSAPSAANTPAPRSAPAAGSASPEPSHDAQFGQELLPPTARPARPEKPEELLSSITAVHLVGPKIYQIALANGQVWRQEGTQITAFLRAGDDVRIERGMMGSYHLSSTSLGAKNWVLVTRLR
jgi:hypothetical protein